MFLTSLNWNNKVRDNLLSLTYILHDAQQIPWLYIYMMYTVLTSRFWICTIFGIFSFPPVLTFPPTVPLPSRNWGGGGGGLGDDGEDKNANANANTNTTMADVCVCKWKHCFVLFFGRRPSSLRDYHRYWHYHSTYRLYMTWQKTKQNENILTIITWVEQSQKLCKCASLCWSSYDISMIQNLIVLVLCHVVCLLLVFCSVLCTVWYVICRGWYDKMFLSPSNGTAMDRKNATTWYHVLDIHMSDAWCGDIILWYHHITHDDIVHDQSFGFRS